MNNIFERMMHACSLAAIQKAINEGIVFRYIPTVSTDGENIVVVDRNNYNGKVVAKYSIRELLDLE